MAMINWGKTWAGYRDREAAKVFGMAFSSSPPITSSSPKDEMTESPEDIVVEPLLEGLKEGKPNRVEKETLTRGEGVYQVVTFIDSESIRSNRLQVIESSMSLFNPAMIAGSQGGLSFGIDIAKPSVEVYSSQQKEYEKKYENNSTEEPLKKMYKKVYK